MAECVLKMEHITKTFSGVTALDDVQFECEKGKVHILAGENGAGKSTILKILAGIYKPDDGTITLNGKKVEFGSPKEAQESGIAMVFQELTLINELTIFENVFLSREQKKTGLIDKKKQLKKLNDCMAEYGINMDPSTIVDRLSVGQKQMVEILKILVRNPDIIILDEPTSALATHEVNTLFSIMRKLTKAEKSLIFISHRMGEMFEVGDKLTVFKDGKYVASCDMKDITMDDLIRMMVGRTLQNIFPPHPEKTEEGEVIFELKNYAFTPDGQPINIEIHKNEIIGIAGLQGHGQTEFINSIAGMHHVYSGESILKGQKKHIRSSKTAVKNGIALVPSDRKQEGLLLDQSIRSNIALASIDKRKKLGFLIDKKAEKKLVSGYKEKLNIKMRHMEQDAMELSGGNQQKVVLAKELAIHPQVILFDEPTKGIDVESKREFYYIMRDLASEGTAVIMYSTDLMEVIGMSDKVLVMYENNVCAQLTGDRINEEEIMRFAMGLGTKEGGEGNE